MKLIGLRLVDRTGYIAQKCRGKKTLHLGCTGWPATQARLDNGTHLHLELARHASVLYGVDIDQEGLAKLRAVDIPNLVHGDVYALERLKVPGDFEVIVAGELIEHLENLGLFLTSVKQVMRPGCELVITTPNAYSVKAMLHALSGYDHQDPTHVLVQSFTTLTQLLGKYGLTVDELCTASSQQLSTRSRLAVTMLWPISRWLPQLADTIVLTARKPA